MTRIGSLFSGAGGLDLAVEQVFSGETVWHCELDPAASKVLAARWPDVPNLGDITKVDWATVEPVDILCGGYPCQPFSAAGQRKGTADERHLWPFFAEAIRVLRPRYVVLENVAGHRSMGFGSVLADLAGIGYDTQWCSVRASDVGAPHRRERVFVVAHPNTGRSRTRIGASRPPKGIESEALAGVARTGAARLPRWWPESAGLVGGSDAAVGGAGPVDLLPTPAARDFKGHGPAGMNRNSPNMSAIGDLLPTPCISDTKTPQDVEKRISGGHQINLADAAITPSQWGKYEPAIRRWEQVTRPAPPPTEPNTKGNPRLSAAFSEWLMGWPAGWVTAVPGISRNDALRIIGNGVVPQQAEAALRWLLSVCEAAA